MDFPLHPEKDDWGGGRLPQGHGCLICGAQIGEVKGFVRLTVGAVLFKDKKRSCGGPSERMDTVFNLWHHGPTKVLTTNEGREVLGDDGVQFHMDIVKPTQGGQVDIVFCSSGCLSMFFANVVQSFETGVKNATFLTQGQELASVNGK